MEEHEPFPPGLRVEYPTREGKAKLARIAHRNEDGTYRLSSGIAAAPVDRLKARELPATAPATVDATGPSAGDRAALAVGTPVEYRRAGGAVRRSVVVG